MFFDRHAAFIKRAGLGQPLGDGVGFCIDKAGGGRRYGQALLFEVFDRTRQMPGLADERDSGEAVLFEDAGRIGGVFCGVVGAVFDPDGFGVEVLLEGFSHGVGFRSAAERRAAGDEDGFAGLSLQASAVA